MKLIAVQRISDQLPVGAKFEIPDHDEASAHTLIEGGYARKDVGEAPAPETPADPQEPKESSVQTVRRTYRRRDLIAEP